MKVVSIPQDTDWNRSFNVLVPLEIQGQDCILVERGQRANQRHGSIGHRIYVNGQFYQVPSWAVKNDNLTSAQPFV